MKGLRIGGWLLALGWAAVLLIGAEVSFKGAPRQGGKGDLLLAQSGPQVPTRGRLTRGACTPSGRGAIVVNPTGSFSALTEGQVEVFHGGRSVGQGVVRQRLSVSTGCSVELRVRLTGLVDQPTVTLRDVSLQSNLLVQTIPVQVETGLVRVEATRGGRRISGVASFFRLDGQGQPSPTAAGTIGANGASREISAGRYQVRLRSGGQTLSEAVNVTAGSTRLVRLTAP